MIKIMQYLEAKVFTIKAILQIVIHIVSFELSVVHRCTHLCFILLTMQHSMPLDFKSLLKLFLKKKKNIYLITFVGYHLRT